MLFNNKRNLHIKTSFRSSFNGEMMSLQKRTFKIIKFGRTFKIIKFGRNLFKTSKLSVISDRFYQNKGNNKIFRVFSFPWQNLFPPASLETRFINQIEISEL